VIALNRFPGDTDEELELVLKYCRTLRVDASICEGYTKGGAGMEDMAAKIVAAANASDPARIKSLYQSDQSLTEKITAVATTVYGAERVTFKPAAKSRLDKLQSLGYGSLPVCIAKTQYSFTDDPKQLGAPVGWTLTISDVTLSAGAGFVVAIAGSMMLMPGLGKVPQAQKLDVDDQGRAIGMDY
jgi:formate--tetrahydrofolate ligase